MRFTGLATAAIALLTATTAAPAPKTKDSDLVLWKDPVAVWFPPNTTDVVIQQAEWAVWENGGRLLKYYNAQGNNGHDKGFVALLNTASVYAIEKAAGPDGIFAVVKKTGYIGHYCPEAIDTCAPQT